MKFEDDLILEKSYIFATCYL